MKSPKKLSLISLRDRLKRKQISVTELVKSYLSAINLLNPQLNIYLALNPKVQDQATVCDREIAINPHIFDKKPLFGLPLAIKDNFLTAGLETTASAKVLDKFIPPFNATVVQKLIDAGALILGKTNMDAWAHGSSTESSDYGPTKNPFDINRLPGGSSGGSAAAVAAGLCAAAIGSETAGSIRQPAAWCGVTGFKPTYGRVSRYGVVAMASSTDSPGPIALNASDCGLLLNSIAGPDPYDATTLPNPYDPFIKPIQPKTLTIGVPSAYMLKEMDSKVLKVIDKAVDTFKSLGCRVIPVNLLDPHYAIGVYTILQRSEVSSNLSRYQGIRYGHDRTHFQEEAKRRIMLGTFSLSTGYFDKYYQKAQKVRSLILADFSKCFQKVDLIIGPTSPGPAQKLGATKDQPMFGEMEDMLVEASSIAGLTGISVPCGFVSHLPIGLQITGPQQAENLVLAAANLFQKVSSWHESLPDTRNLDPIIYEN